MVVGLIFLVMGIILVLQAAGIIGGSFWGLFWGILFLVIGIKLISKRHHRCLQCAMVGHHGHCGGENCMKSSQAKEGSDAQ